MEENEPTAVSGIEISPFALLRQAALPYSLLSSLAPPKLSRLIYEILQARDEAARLRPLLEDALHAVIPAIEDRALRGAAIRLRRDIHNDRPASIALPLALQIRACLGEAEQATLDLWLHAQASAKKAEGEAEASFSEQVQGHLRPRLRGALVREDFGRALALASPDLQLALAREQDRPPISVHATKVEKSLLSYLCRATVKTSPFSTFMHVIPIAVTLSESAAVPGLEGLTRHRKVRLNRGIFNRLYRHIVARHGNPEKLFLGLNTTAKDAGEGRVEALVNVDMTLLGRPWRQTRVAYFRFHAAVLECLFRQPGQLTWEQWRKRLMDAGLSGPQAHSFILKCLERDLLWPPPWTDCFDLQPEHSLLQALTSDRFTVPPATLHVVNALHQSALRFADADGPQRAQNILQIRHLEKQALHELGVEKADEFANVILEDSWLCGATGALGGKLPERLAELGTFLSTQLAFTPEYVRLRSAFLHRYGVGGRCNDLIGFLMKVGDKLVDIPELGARPRLDPPLLARPGLRIGVTAQVQIAAASAESAAAGDALIVVNRVHERIGWLAARFAATKHPDHNLLRERLRTWIRQSVAPREPVDFVVNGQCNDLQNHPRLTSRVLAWPGEPLRISPTEALRAEELVMRHDPDSDLLELFDGAGVPVALLYLGTVLPTPSWGMSYALAVLCQPLQVLRPALSPAVLGESAADVVFEPRRTEGHLVLTRATWWVRARRLREVWLASTGVRRLLDVAAECRVHGIPETFFAKRKVDTNFTKLIPYNAIDGTLKPLWVDTRNPFCLDLLERVTREGEWVALSESLPAGDNLWSTVEGERYVSELHVEMMISAQAPVNA